MGRSPDARRTSPAPPAPGLGITSGAALKSGGTDTFADTPVHSATTSAATVTATRTVTVTGAAVRALTEPDPFTLGRGTVTRHGGAAAAAKFPVTNDGVISNVPVGINVWAETSIVNGGGTPLRVTAIKAPAGQYTVAGLPKPGAVIRPGEAIPVQAEFTPAHTGSASSSFTITINKGQNLTVTLGGTGLKPVTRFASVPARVNFGPTPRRSGSTSSTRVTR